MPFELLLHDTQLPASVCFLTLIFGSKGVKVQKQMDGSWLGKTPRKFMLCGSVDEDLIPK